MTHQGRASSGAAPSVCEGHKERDICACDGGLVSEPLPPVQAVTGRAVLRSDTVKTRPLNTVLSRLLSQICKRKQPMGPQCTLGMARRSD